MTDEENEEIFADVTKFALFQNKTSKDVLVR